MQYQGSISIPSDTTSYLSFTLLERGFAFLEGGHVNITFSDFRFTALNWTLPNQQPSVPKVVAAVCDQSRFTFASIAYNSSLLQSYFCEPTGVSKSIINGCTGLFEYDPLKVEAVWSYSIPTTGVYDSFLVACPRHVNTTFRVSIDAVNPGLPIVRYLGYYDMQALFIEIGFLGVWAVLSVVWVGLWIRNWNMRNKLHGLISLIPVGQIAWISYVTARYIQLGLNGPQNVDTNAFLIAQLCSLFLKEATLIACLLLISKGWGIARVRLSPTEIRTMAGCGMFYTITSVLASYDSAFRFSNWLFTLTTYYYLFWSISIHIHNLEKYVTLVQTKLDSLDYSDVNSEEETVVPPSPQENQNIPNSNQENTEEYELQERDSAVQAPPVSRRISSLWTRNRLKLLFLKSAWKVIFPVRPVLEKDPFGNRVRAMGQDWNLILTIQSKLWMLKSSNNIIAFLFLFTVIDKAGQALGVNVIPFYPTFPLVYQVLGFLWMAYVFQLRQPDQIVVVPRWLQEREGEEMSDPVPMEADSDGRRGRVLAELRRRTPRNRIIEAAVDAMARRWLPPTATTA
ncbi:hypothetical protein BCR33DRAFT_853439 [Rhizoclosmatium globosum]|uniref:Intimal thickness related receptor IRP domain-containing protein n=1 Tax=Rhizoclosmatium globosum TaxID=329046 RepID=A0A1Y2BWY7_9FUNG|nr:hypothetical protein BCR33DRAFT_853439 [Rhizoclosmatium globosum]|eukprot:ORY39280.1 hypothetical protein BCR33DRAFT_853439 [Rhizoclosmatium globosum]